MRHANVLPTNLRLSIKEVSSGMSGVYDGATVTVLVKQINGSYLPTTVNVYDALFNNSNYTSTAGGVQAWLTRLTMRCK